MPTPRMSLMAVTGADGRIYAIAGRDQSSAPLTVVESLDTAAGTWRTEPSLSHARYWFGAALGSDGIYAAGGIDSEGFTDSIEALSNGTWSDLPAMPDARGWITTAATNDGRILVIGGILGRRRDRRHGPPPLASMMAFDVAAQKWSE